MQGSGYDPDLVRQPQKSWQKIAWFLFANVLAAAATLLLLLVFFL
ncbi:hypothetical protein [Thalassospira profundimaris]|nr:hypothetical protein [Thalassospira profundimaris]